MARAHLCLQRSTFAVTTALADRWLTPRLCLIAISCAALSATARRRACRRPARERRPRRTITRDCGPSPPASAGVAARALTDARFESNRARVSNRVELNDELQSIFATKTVDHWVMLLNEASIPAGPIYSVPHLFEDRQVKHLRVVQEAVTADGHALPMIAQPVTLERTPAKISTPVPEFGEHTDAILAELGFSTTAIAELRNSHVV